jgi:hypothetical protein
MFKTGLTSVTFRSLEPGQIMDLAVRAGLDAIEWGGDIHVPHGDRERAGEIGQATRDRGLIVSSYGSYYRLCAGGGGTGRREDRENPSFEAVLETAVELGAPTVRVWAGDRPSSEADSSYRRKLTEETLDIAEKASRAEISIAFEYHRNTLTDSDRSVRRLIDDCFTGSPADNIRLYWQPPLEASPEEREAGLKTVIPWLENLHVFFALPGSSKPERRPLLEGESEWKRYLSLAAGAEGDHFALIEFVQGDSPGQFLEDARVLRGLLGAKGG